MRALIFFLSFLFTQSTFAASSCSIFEKIAKEGLSENQQFWQEYASIQNKSDSAIQELISKHKSAPSIQASPVAKIANQVESSVLTERANVSASTRAFKKFERLPEHLQAKVNEFTKLWEEKGRGAIAEFKKRGMNFEKLPQVDGYSVRLNDGNRILFKLEGNSARIIDIGSDVYTH